MAIPLGFEEHHFDLTNEQFCNDEIDYGNKDLVLIAAPADFDIDKLQGQDYILDGSIPLQSTVVPKDQNELSWEIHGFSAKSDRHLNVLLPSKESGQLTIGPKLHASLTIVRNIHLPHIRYPKKKKTLQALPKPDYLRARWKPFGAGCPVTQKSEIETDAVAFDEVATKQSEVDKFTTKKKKSKRKDQNEFEVLTPVIKDDTLDETFKPDKHVAEAVFHETFSPVKDRNRVCEETDAEGNESKSKKKKKKKKKKSNNEDENVRIVAMSEDDTFNGTKIQTEICSEDANSTVMSTGSAFSEKIDSEHDTPVKKKKKRKDRKDGNVVETLNGINTQQVVDSTLITTEDKEEDDIVKKKDGTSMKKEKRRKDKECEDAKTIGTNQEDTGNSIAHVTDLPKKKKKKRIKSKGEDSDKMEVSEWTDLLKKKKKNKGEHVVTKDEPETTDLSKNKIKIEHDATIDEPETKDLSKKKKKKKGEHGGTTDEPEMTDLSKKKKKKKGEHGGTIDEPETTDLSKFKKKKKKGEHGAKIDESETTDLSKNKIKSEHGGTIDEPETTDLSKNKKKIKGEHGATTDELETTDLSKKKKKIKGEHGGTIDEAETKDLSKKKKKIKGEHGGTIDEAETKDLSKKKKKKGEHGVTTDEPETTDLPKKKKKKMKREDDDSVISSQIIQQVTERSTLKKESESPQKEKVATMSNKTKVKKEHDISKHVTELTKVTTKEYIEEGDVPLADRIDQTNIRIIKRENGVVMSVTDMTEVPKVKRIKGEFGVPTFVPEMDVIPTNKEIKGKDDVAKKMKRIKGEFGVPTFVPEMDVVPTNKISNGEDDVAKKMKRIKGEFGVPTFVPEMDVVPTNKKSNGEDDVAKKMKRIKGEFGVPTFVPEMDIVPTNKIRKGEDVTNKYTKTQGTVSNLVTDRADVDVNHNVWKDGKKKKKGVVVKMEENSDIDTDIENDIFGIPRENRKRQANDNGKFNKQDDKKKKKRTS